MNLHFIGEEAEISRDATAGPGHRALSPQQAFQPAPEGYLSGYYNSWPLPTKVPGSWELSFVLHCICFPKLKLSLSGAITLLLPPPSSFVLGPDLVTFVFMASGRTVSVFWIVRDLKSFMEAREIQISIKGKTSLLRMTCSKKKEERNMSTITHKDT